LEILCYQKSGLIKMNNLDYISNKNQLCNVTKFIYTEGKAKGTKAIRVNNGIGLDFVVLTDRGMDIGELYFKGELISYMSETGVVNPCYFNEKGDQWLRSFGGGFLVTCGLTQVGEPCSFNGENYGLHGNISNIPASEVSYCNRILGQNGYVTIRGEVHQAKHQGENLLLDRTIKVNNLENKLLINDRICNNGLVSQPLMILYHYNFGFPFLRPGFKILADIDINESIGLDEYSRANIHTYNDFYTPRAMREDLTIAHRLKTGQVVLQGKTSKIKLLYNTEHLPFMGQWKHLCKREYVLGIEPCNNHIKGIAYENDNSTLRYIKPDETIENQFEIEFMKNENE
jgi:hypothetical protein